MSEASDITRRAKSNLAIALKLVPRDRREDMTVFYAFCRTIDDIADDDARPLDERARLLDEWEAGVTRGFEAPDAFQREVAMLIECRDLPRRLFTSIITGCRSDLDAARRFKTWEGDLERYSWNVAGAVGHVSVRLFGCGDLPAAERYATELGHALQLTNILRDVGEDLSHGRIYLLLDEIEACGLSEGDLFARRHDERFARLAALVANRAERHFHRAADALPETDRAVLLPARVMATIYRELLENMRKDDFRVLDRRHRVSKARQLAILARHISGRA